MPGDNSDRTCVKAESSPQPIYGQNHSLPWTLLGKILTPAIFYFFKLYDRQKKKKPNSNENNKQTPQVKISPNL